MPWVPPFRFVQDTDQRQHLKRTMQSDVQGAIKQTSVLGSEGNGEGEKAHKRAKALENCLVELRKDEAVRREEALLAAKSQAESSNGQREWHA